MDQELVQEISDLDVNINSLAIRPGVNLDKLKDIQSQRSSLDAQMVAFREQMAKQQTEFHHKLHSEIQSLQRSIKHLLDNIAKKQINNS